MYHKWCNAAEIRREQIDNGLDITFCDVFVPRYQGLVEKIQPKTILEVGAGTGHLSKSLSALGSAITAIEPSTGMFKVASNVLDDIQNVELKNLTIEDFSSDKVFDIIISHLVAHTHEDIDVFFQSVLNRMSSHSHFIFSIPHPCFYNDYKNFLGDDYQYMVEKLTKVSFGISKDKENIISDVPYHHRPLSYYLNSLTQMGFILKDLEEVWPSLEVQEKYGSTWNSPRYCILDLVKGSPSHAS